MLCVPEECLSGFPGGQVLGVLDGGLCDELAQEMVQDSLHDGEAPHGGIGFLRHVQHGTASRREWLDLYQARYSATADVAMP